jgi:hypothetical protein
LSHPTTIGQAVKMLEVEYTSELSAIPREKYDEHVIGRFRKFVADCDRVLSNRKIAPSQADRVMTYKILVEKEIEWFTKKSTRK